MILTGTAIADAVRRGDICLDPFDPSCLNPNSYNYRLGPILRTDSRETLDPFESSRTTDHVIPPSGFTLEANRLYLGNTVERIGSDKYVPMLIGRSSLGRLGLFLQISADLGQLGAFHRWTLEIVATQPLRLYSGMIIGQISFWRTSGRRVKYSGYYGRRSDPAPCEPLADRNRHRT